MNDPVVVGVVQSLGHLRGHVSRLAEARGLVREAGSVAVLVDPLRQGAPIGDELHGQKGEPRFLSARVHANDPRVIEPRRGGGLAVEATATVRRAREARQQHLESDVPLERDLFRAKDDAHAALADHLEGPEVAEPRGEAGEREGLGTSLASPDRRRILTEHVQEIEEPPDLPHEVGKPLLVVPRGDGFPPCATVRDLSEDGLHLGAGRVLLLQSGRGVNNEPGPF